MDMPPTRYRVVEQGRRLVVVDTWSGEPVHPPAVPMPEMPGETRRRMEAPRAPDRPAPRARKPEPRGRYAGGEGFSFETASWYDAEGPRTIRLNQDGQTQLIVVGVVVLAALAFLIAIGGWWLLFPLVFLVLNDKTRSGVRTATTTWLTALDTSEG